MSCPHPEDLSLKTPRWQNERTPMRPDIKFVQPHREAQAQSARVLSAQAPSSALNNSLQQNREETGKEPAQNRSHRPTRCKSTASRIGKPVRNREGSGKNPGTIREASEKSRISTAFCGLFHLDFVICPSFPHITNPHSRCRCQT